MRVEVGTAKSKTALDGEYSYAPNSEPDKGGGAFVLTAPERVRYYFLTVDGVPLAGIWFDEGTARDDARIIENALSGRKGESDAT